MKRACALLIVLLNVSCVGTAGVVIVVQGHVVDAQSQNYDQCIVTLYRAESDDVVTYERFTGRSFSPAFTVRSLNEGFEVGVTCDGAAHEFRSERIGRGHVNPADLGTIELRRLE
jgi:hypothetical protein